MIIAAIARCACFFLWMGLLASATGAQAMPDTNPLPDASPAATAAATDAVREVLQRYAAAWRRGDMLAIVDAYHAQFTLNYPGTHALAGRHVGKARALQVLAEFGRRTDRRLEEVIAVMAGPERGALLVRESIGPASRRIAVERLFVYTVQDGKLKECWVFDADPAEIARLLQ